MLPEVLIRTSDLPEIAVGIPMFPEFPQDAGGCVISVVCGIGVLVGVGRPWFADCGEATGKLARIERRSLDERWLAGSDVGAGNCNSGTSWRPEEVF